MSDRHLAFAPAKAGVADPSALPRVQPPVFASRFLGGFECSTQRRPDGRRLDLLASTGHDRCFEADYRSLLQHGIAAARDGMRWHLIESAPGRYDWSSLVPMLRAARRAGVQVAWDLCHYGWPDDIDFWSSVFVERFSSFAAEAARVVSQESDMAPVFCPVNEISFWAWAGGEMGHFWPMGRGRGRELKRQLVRASTGAMAAIRSVVPEARFLHCEPLIHVEPHSMASHEVEGAEAYRLSQFEAFDMICGRLAPELGGDPAFLDLVGVNFYPHNQWYYMGGTIPLGHHAYRPLREMLAEVSGRYARPLILAETGSEGTARPSWLHYVCSEVRAAQRLKVPVRGICLYPILDYPGWDNDRPCSVGLFSMPDRQGRRTVDHDFARELELQQASFSRAVELKAALRTRARAS